MADHHRERADHKVHVGKLGEGGQDRRAERRKGVGLERRGLGSEEIVGGEIDLQGDIGPEPD